MMRYMALENKENVSPVRLTIFSSSAQQYHGLFWGGYAMILLGRRLRTLNNSLSRSPAASLARSPDIDGQYIRPEVLRSDHIIASHIVRGHCSPYALHTSPLQVSRYMFQDHKNFRTRDYEEVHISLSMAYNHSVRTLVHYLIGTAIIYTQVTIHQPPYLRLVVKIHRNTISLP